ncbi:glutathione S-transferase N-terminal domain-containing protein [Candidatus Woesearchaeota archaeon]|nr:glutathione S-transferase N-terminal domain-containing protein [Candidatus Woesearchaeota archaeon]
MAKVNVKVYTTSTCPWCVRAKEFLKMKNIKFTEINVGEDEKGRNEMLEKSGQMGVPVIEIEKEGREPVIIIGFDKDAIQEAVS